MSTENDKLVEEVVSSGRYLNFGRIFEIGISGLADAQLHAIEKAAAYTTYAGSAGDKESHRWIYEIVVRELEQRRIETINTENQVATAKAQAVAVSALRIAALTAILSASVQIYLSFWGGGNS